MTDLVGFPTPRLQSRASLLGTWLDGATVGIYSGTRPAANGGAITDQVLLCEVTLDDPAGEAEDGVWTCSPLPDPGTNVADGTATWARVIDPLDDVVCDLDVGTTGSGAAVLLDNASIVSGATTEIVSFTITET
jgi:hypothetical protein